VSDNFDPAAQAVTDHAIAMGVAAGRGSTRRKPSRPAVLRADTPEGVCANCETKLEGPVCHMCGQVDDEYHRPVHGLFSEVIEGLFALDGRVARTLPALLLFPGRVTRAFLKGKRMRYMPPFRLYIIASLLFFLLVPLSGNLGGMANDMQDGWGNYQPDGIDLSAARLEIEEQVASGTMTEEDAESALQALERIGFTTGRESESQNTLVTDTDSGAVFHLTPLGPKRLQGSEAAINPDKVAAADFSLPIAEAPEMGVADKLEAPVAETSVANPFLTGVIATPDGETSDFGPLQNNVSGNNIRQFFAPEDFGEPAPQTIWPLQMRRYLGERFAHVADDPGDWLESAADWVPRVMFAMVPVYALLLGLVYVWRRGFYLYDHMIVSLHFHAALFLSMAILSKASLLIGAGWATLAMIVYSNLYLYKLHRKVYERGRFQSVVRTLTLSVLYGFVLMLGLFAVFLLGAVIG
jgi:hypothetical protein